MKKEFKGKKMKDDIVVMSKKWQILLFSILDDFSSFFMGEWRKTSWILNLLLKWKKIWKKKGYKSRSITLFYFFFVQIYFIH